MGLFDRLKKNSEQAAAKGSVIIPLTEDTSPAPGAPSGVDLGKKSGAISLAKGARVTIEKTPTIKAVAKWSSLTDYDLYALVLTKDGVVHTVSTFGTADQPHSYSESILSGAVKHLGDVGRQSDGAAQEIIEIKLTPDILAVVPVAYSAQSNGTGSFRRYKVDLGIDNGSGTQVSISSANAERNDKIYSVAIGIIRNTADGVQIEALEAYSRPNSENRPVLLPDGTVQMDAGPKNAYK